MRERAVSISHQRARWKPAGMTAGRKNRRRSAAELSGDYIVNITSDDGAGDEGDGCQGQRLEVIRAGLFVSHGDEKRAKPMAMPLAPRYFLLLGRQVRSVSDIDRPFSSR